MEILEKTQYNAALAITGTWKGTNTDKIYEELGWESLHNRRFSRRLIMLYKILHNLTPTYLKTPIPQSQHNYALRRNLMIPPIPCRIDKYKSSFYPDAISSWNKLDPNLKSASSLSIFKSSLSKIIRPVKKDTFNITDPSGTKWLFQLRVGLSHLKAHKLRHNFLDTPNDICACTLESETTKHFLLLCPLHSIPRIALMRSVNPILLLNDLENISDVQLVNLLLYGHETLNPLENKIIIKSTLAYIKATSHFPT